MPPPSQLVLTSISGSQAFQPHPILSYSTIMTTKIAKGIIKTFCPNDSKTFKFLFDDSGCSGNLVFVCSKNTRTKSQSPRSTRAFYDISRHKKNLHAKKNGDVNSPQ